jgi:Rne/Rng family ribonuclease
MAKEICISSTPHETRLAILEDDQLAEIYYERENEYTLAGSIYKGRVTRVLPGMQSAFVDIGLERDAFLYVTDFLDEQEDSEDYERINPQAGRREGKHARGDGKEHRESHESRDGQEIQQKAEQQDQQNDSISGEQPEDEEFDRQGTRRWRGRRGRRRGFRSHSQQRHSSEAESSLKEAEPQQTNIPAAEEHEDQPTSSALPEAPQKENRVAAAPTVPFVLPGESLSKYGGHPAEKAETNASTPSASRRPAPHPKPSTLIETPIIWDGNGLLPGESRALLRSSEKVQSGEHIPAQPVEVFADATAAAAPVEEKLENSEASAAPTAVEEESQVTLEPQPAEIDPVLEEAAVRDEPHADAAVVEELAQKEEEEEEHTGDASASYRVDPAAPSEFRLTSTPETKPVAHEDVQTPEIFAEAEAQEEQLADTPVIADKPEHPEAQQASPFAESEAESTVEEEYFFEPSTSESTAEPGPQTKPSETRQVFAPGAGLLEEEIIDEEEDELAFFHTPFEEHEFDDLEEETLDQQFTSGDIGEMFQEAHLDHRIQLSFGAGTETEEDEMAEEVDSDIEAEAEAFVSEIEGEEEEIVVEEGAAPAPQRRREDRKHRGRQKGRRGPARRATAQTTDLPVISDLLKPGQEILVQIAKEPIAKKGARITSHIALPGRFLVFMPTVNHVGVSRKISSDEERQRLKRILISEKGEVSGGFIVRTAADGATEEELRADMRFLLNLWSEIKHRTEAGKAPSLIYHDLNLVERILRDQVTDNFSTIWVDSEADYERIVRFLNRFQPSLMRRVKLYTKETPLFEQFGIQDEITKALKSKVWLKSGGSIVINQTEALVAIDINTGKYVGKTARLEDTILKTNLDAIPEIVRQIRLRDLGGIIVIDFIDMDERKNRHKVMQALEEALKADRAPSKVLQFNDFGLVAITRKRVKQSLERTLSVQCPICTGTGMVKSAATVCNEIYIEMRKMRRHFEHGDVLLRVNPEVVKALKANNARWLTELEEMIGRNIIVKSDPTLHPEQFDIH